MDDFFVRILIALVLGFLMTLLLWGWAKWFFIDETHEKTLEGKTEEQKTYLHKYILYKLPSKFKVLISTLLFAMILAGLLD